ncbi:Aminoacid dehydrogenase-like protein [Auriscalpium vulgare]|uniref:Aminoacid dehydrogenase-like protein n=1 Tax=Auriscalpium vulgare TaxID=40419 RepID=A0ACB8RT27_9AGAM|nr:Aminoacid dehydrogenase-like protein [Auriscalpium vulgare]
MAHPTLPKGLLLKADTIAAPFQAEIRASLAQSTRARPPTLVGILSTASAPSRSYAEFTRKQCDALGVRFVLKEVGAAVSGVDGVDGDGVEEAIIEANDDAEVDGIMVYYPIFGGQQDHYLQQVVSPLKDVEGLNFKFHYNLYHNIRFLDPRTLLSPATPSAATFTFTPTTTAPKDDVPPPGTAKSILPCTPLAVVKCLEALGVYNAVLPYGDRAYGRTVTVINRCARPQCL